MPSNAFFHSQNAPKSVSWSFTPDPLGKLTALSRPLAGFKRATFRQKGDRERKRERRGTEVGKRRGNSGTSLNMPVVYACLLS